MVIIISIYLVVIFAEFDYNSINFVVLKYEVVVIKALHELQSIGSVSSIPS